MPINALARTVNQLWPDARAMALRCCGHTLRRLNRGDGGLYTSEDLLQDLYIEFHHTVKCWFDDGGDRDDLEPLWLLWRRVLWGGGRRIIRRKPYRLWDSPEESVDPAVLELDTSPDDPCARCLPRHALTELTEVSGPEPVPGDEAFLDAWARLDPLRARALYMRIVMGYSGTRIARELHLINANAAYIRVYQARKCLRQRLAGGYSARRAVEKEARS